MRYEFDPEEHKANLVRVLADVARRGIAEIVFGGDIGAKELIPWFFEMVKREGFKLTVTLGNHDRLDEVRPYLPRRPDSHGARWYFAEEDESVKWIYLDSSANVIGDDQTKWLTRELDTPKTVLLFVHHPVLEIDTPLDRIGAALKDREAVENRLQHSGREIAIFCGHYHMVDEATVGEIRQYLTPAVSYQIEKQAKVVAIDQTVFGYRIITVEGSRIETTVVTLGAEASLG